MGAWLGDGCCALYRSVVEGLWLVLWAEDAVEEESLPGTILSDEKAFWQGVASHEVCAGARKRRRFLRTRMSRTRCLTTKVVKTKEKVAQKVESNSKKPHRAAGELTLSERKFFCGEYSGEDGGVRRE